MSDAASDDPFSPDDDMPSDVPIDAPPDVSRLPAGLVLVSTPIGNLGDMTRRAIDTLKAADVILCEDTRVTARLCSEYGIRTRTQPLHEHNEDARIPGVLEMLRQGKRVALVSDAGAPLVSDPGYRLVRAALAEGLPVGGVPGANAALLALSLSGLPPHPFLFLGFPPPRSGGRRAAFAGLRAAEAAGLSATLIWYEAPHRLAECLEDLAAVFGERPAAVARELTKRFEEVRRASLGELAAHYAAHAARGEITLVVGPPSAEAVADEGVEALLAGLMETMSLKEAVAQVTARTGLPRKQVYAMALAMTR